jgi:DNA mismatch repair ATPase MutS
LIHFDLLKIGNQPKIAVAEDVRADLELDKIVAVASNNDKLIADTWLEVLLLEGSSEDVVTYRQEAVKDALTHRETILKMYSLTGEVLERLRREVFYFRTDDPVGVVHETSRGIKIFADALEELMILLKSASSFSSKAFSELVTSLSENIDEKFISSARDIARIFEFGEDTDFSVRIGKYNSLKDPVLLVPKEKNSLFARVLNLRRAYTYRLDPRDESGAQILHDIKAWALSQVATTLLKAYKHMKSFFEDLRKQLSFYVGVINMSDFFEGIGLPKVYPKFAAGKFAFENLYCLSLAISGSGKPVPYTLDVDVDKAFAVLISGVNKGGKTTFLKAVGQALLLARAGLFIPAESFTLPTPGAVYTHFLREEERTMSYGKFEEEVKRFRSFVDSLKKGDFVLMDESFSTTNPVEASVVAENIVSALVDSGVNVFYVTFLHDFIHQFIKRYGKKTILLIPERLGDGTRTFRLVRGSLQPGYAIDLWRKVSGTSVYDLHAGS